MDSNVIENLYSKFKDADCISIDSREVKNLILKGQKVLFFCLKGENFDANNFVCEVLDIGVTYVVTENITFKEDKRAIVVADSLVALQQLAHHHREQLGIPVISITGSNGKTTTKELLHKVLSKKYMVSATVGNFNNHIGVPLTLLAIPPNSEIAIVEMGANHQHEIEELCKIAMPNFGMITNIGDAHLEGFGGREGVIKGKGELYDFLHLNKGVIFCHQNDATLLDMCTKRVGAKLVNYGSSVLVDSTKGDFKGVSFEYKEMKVSTNLIGDYNIFNIDAAIAIGEYFGVDKESITSAISEYLPQNMRSELRVTDRGNRVIIDAYNANPSSMHLSLQNFDNIASDRRCYIIGQMNEMGDYSSVKHLEVVNIILEQIERVSDARVILVGAAYKELENKDIYCKDIKEFDNKGLDNNIIYLNKVDEVATYLTTTPLLNYDILLKGSRGISLEKLLPLL